MKKLLALLVAALLIVCASLALAEPVAIKALILPKFESGEMAGDFPGEAQYYYEGYCEGGKSYDIVGCPNPLYVKDGVALCVTGMGKVNSAMTLQAILMDDRFDFSNAYIISTGCAGSAIEYGVMGDVFVITTEPDDVYAIQEDLAKAGYEILSAEKTKRASTGVTLENEDDIKFMNLLIEKLEEDDDVMDVYHNWENCDR